MRRERETGSEGKGISAKKEILAWRRENIKKIARGTCKLQCLRKVSMSYRRKGENIRQMYLSIYIGNREQFTKK